MTIITIGTALYENLEVLEWLQTNVGVMTRNCRDDDPLGYYTYIGEGWKIGACRIKNDPSPRFYWDVHFDDDRSAMMFLLRWGT